MAVVEEQIQVEEEVPSTSSAPSTSREEAISIEAFRPTYRFWLVFAAFAVLTLMVAIDSTSLSVALSIIANKLHGTAIEAFWAGTSFLLASTVSVAHHLLILFTANICPGSSLALLPSATYSDVDQWSIPP